MLFDIRRAMHLLPLAGLLFQYFAYGSFAFQTPDRGSSRAQVPAISKVTAAEWAALNKTVGGRLERGRPLAAPCYATYNGEKNTQIDLKECAYREANKINGFFLASYIGGYDQSEWANCISKSQSCPLDFNSTAPSSPVHGNCEQGSVSSYYILVLEPSDVQAGVNFARKHGIPLVVKNTGHDYKGRSAAPNSLALWTHTYQPKITLTRDFTPAGCSKKSGHTGDVVTFGAGQTFLGIYEFASENNVTVVGGSSSTVGAAGGWITGGGHSALSPTLGLGVDNVQELKVVLPNGTFITTSRCQHPDIFYALRGGGGNTFGVVVEMTTRAHPQATLQYALLVWGALNSTSLHSLLSVITANANKWSDEGFGGYIIQTAGSFIFSFLTPVLTTAQANSTLRPLFDFPVKPAVSNLTQYEGYYGICESGLCTSLDNQNNLGSVLSSRLISRDVLAKQPAKVASVLSDMADQAVAQNDTNATPIFACMTSPNPKYVKDDGTSSVTPAWRNSTWHLISVSQFDNNADLATVEKHFKMIHNRIQPLRDLTPGSGAYQNEADTYEPNHQESFWGAENYNRLLKIKKELDPTSLMTVHQGIGADATDERFACYPKGPS